MVPRPVVPLHPSAAQPSEGGTVMTATPRTTIVGVFDSRPQAQHALDELRRAGFREGQVALVAKRPDQEGIEVTDLDAARAAQVTGESKAEEGAGAGAAVGAVAGGLMALPALIPGVGPIL